VNAAAHGREMTVVFFVLNEMMTGVVASQVIAPARAYAAALPQVAFRVVFLEPARIALTARSRKRLASLRRQWPEGRIALYPYVGRLGEFAPARTLGVAARLLGARRGPVVFHCRGPEATLQAARVAADLDSARVVFDARGASGPEAVVRLAARGGSIDPETLEATQRRGEIQDRRAVERADAVAAVSDALLRELLGERELAGRVSGVIPCCVDRPLFSPDGRLAERERLGLGDEILLVHTSTEARWEAFDQVVALFRAVRARRPAKLLFLTTLGAEVVTAAMASDDPLRDDVIVRSAQSNEVAGILSAADVGVLLRRSHGTHRVASPIKFAEYLGAGLAVAVSDGIGAVGRVVEREGLGVVIRAEAEAEDFGPAADMLVRMVEAGRESIRERAIRVCEEQYTWNRYVPTVTRLYGLA
jgi:glycosyltransferase involved in cell wall biosynthesis